MYPAVSVIVTTYNQAAYIAECLSSVFAQTLPPCEVIVVNDGSIDDTDQVIEPFRDRIRYYYQDNQGVAAARNSAVRRARGEYAAFLDGDDLWRPEKLEIQMGVARRYPEAGLIVVDGVQFDRDDILAPSLIRCPLEEFLTPLGNNLYFGRAYRKLLEGNLICTTSQVVVPSGVLNEVGESDRGFPIASDYDLYLRIARTRPIAVIKTSLMGWRYHAGSASGPHWQRDFNWTRDMLRVWQKHLRLAEPDDTGIIRDSIRRRLGETALEAYYRGCKIDPAWGRSHLWKLLKENPSHWRLGIYLLGLCCPVRVPAKLKRPLKMLARIEGRGGGER